MVQNQAGLFTGSLVIFIDLASDVVRVSNLLQTTQGARETAGQRAAAFQPNGLFLKLSTSLRKLVF